jgi:nucleoside-triphosphatase
MAKNIFITGKPGSGKTTLVREVCLPFHERLGGFYTEEIRDGGERRGFIIKTFDGREGIFALKGFKSPVKLNKYGIDLKVLEDIGVGALERALREKEAVVIDEIGSMEIVSEAFRGALLQTLASPKPVLATIRFNSQPFTDEVKRMADTALLYLSRDNFAEVKQTVREWLDKRVSS